MGTRLLRGRFFDQNDSATGAPVVLVNESFARHYWPSQNPLGRHIQASREVLPREVVGVVADAKISALSDSGDDQLYVPSDQLPYAGMTLVVRSTSPSRPLVEGVRGRIAEVDPTIPLSGIRTMDEVVGASVSRPRLIAIITGIFAGFALLLSAIGVYGVMAYSVSTRKQEMGIRLALGAAPGDILRLVVGQGMRMTLVGVAAGMIFSLLLTRLLASLLYDVRSTDPVVFGGASLTLLGTALLACYIPARRATRVDPIVALRYG
jgi:putative ABC transport system permease protein